MNDEYGIILQEASAKQQELPRKKLYINFEIFSEQTGHSLFTVMKFQQHDNNHKITNNLTRYHTHTHIYMHMKKCNFDVTILY